MACCVLAASCFVPDDYQCEIRVTRDGSYGITFIGVLTYAPLYGQIVRKGSIAIDGISLTVAGVDDRRLDVQIIPYTWEHTTLKAARVNDMVNLECDMIGKYVLRAMEVLKDGKK